MLMIQFLDLIVQLCSVCSSQHDRWIYYKSLPNEISINTYQTRAAYATGKNSFLFPDVFEWLAIIW